MVVDFRLKTDRDEASYHYPIFVFAEEAGNPQQICSDGSYGGTLTYKKDKPVPILYDPSTPADARIDWPVSMWIGAFACIVATAVLVAA